MSEVISVEKLSKKFASLAAVNDLSFTVTGGEVYGFLGQNGAGKSTTIRMLLTLVKQDSGNISIFGLNNRQSRREVLQKVGAVIERPDLYQYLTAMENLKLFAKLSGLNLTNAQLQLHMEKVGIGDRSSSKVKTFSQGMKQRLAIACALVHNPGLIILDEPTNGLDPQGIADIRNLMLHLSREEGKTIFVSSHLLSEIELVADSMLIIDKGKKVAEGKVTELLNPADTIVSIETTNNAHAIELVKTSGWADSLVNGQQLQLRMHKDGIPELARLLVNGGSEITAITPKHSLEDFFLSLTTYNQHVAAYKN
jgi:ABC-type multidrug transport system ATPase subunit